MSSAELNIESHPEGATIPVWLQPRAARNEIVGVRESALHVRVTAPPVDGRANETLCKLVADVLDLPARDVVCLSGHRSRRKRLLVHNASADAVYRKLSAAIAADS